MNRLASRESHALRSLVSLVCVFCLTAASLANPHAGDPAEQDITERDPKAAARQESVLVSGTRQLTFEGRRAGEGYFSRDGSKMVFQSEREPGNPFFQIYRMDLETGDVDRVSPGSGKTTCAWIHPESDHVLFASTHEDERAVEKQREEIEMRETGKERRYSWDYDEHFELYTVDPDLQQYRNLTNARGYDAEASWSPDGRLIAFTSNRQAYERELTDEERRNFEIDAAYLNEIYLMDSDGSNVRRLTNTAGYDGGPFFSPDGGRICWRRFTPNGAIAEVWTMKVDGSDKRQLTRLNAMSWAPFYHPSGEYLIFTTNRHGFSNFELYLVDVAGKSPPVRVTYTPGFDGLPVFTPDGTQLCWTSNRTASKKSQLFVANWNHERARQLLGLDTAVDDQLVEDEVKDIVASSRKQASSGFAAQDVMRHVDYLCRKELGGRLTGTRGEKLATAYVAAYLDSLGVRPAGDEGSWYQGFEFTSGVALGEGNYLASSGQTYEVDRDWRPLSFSATGSFGEAPVVFAGYGIVVPGNDNQAEYDSYVHLDVRDKWVVVLRYMPENISAERRQHLSRPSQLRFKTMLARDRGARGLIVVSGPQSNAKNQLVALRSDGTASGSSLPVISVTDAVVAEWLGAMDKDLGELQQTLDTGEPMMGFEFPDRTLGMDIEIEQLKRSGRNVLGRLQAGDQPSSQVVVVGAHIDHLGRGASGSSLARDDERGNIHFGADDNASGVAAMLEVAEYLADQQRRGKLRLRRDVLFAAWSGEELGLIGSSHFVKDLREQLEHASAHAAHGAHHPPAGDAAHGGQAHGEAAHGEAAHGEAAHGGGDATGSAAPHSAGPHSTATPQRVPIYPVVAACLNMDMVGRLDKNLVLQGVGSSNMWRSEIERRNAPVGLPIVLQEDSYLPTDANSFYVNGVPILSAFTGSHSEYHTPRDTPDTLNYDGAAKVAHFMGLVARSLARRQDVPDYVARQAPEQGQRRASLRAYLGTVPDYADEVKGVKLSGATKNGPAEKAGVQGGDVIVELAGKKIENIYDYTYAIEALKIGEEVEIVVQRGDQRVKLKIVPGSRE